MNQRVPFVRILIITSLVCVSVSPACTGNPIQPSELLLGRPFEVRPATSAILQDGLKITFNGVRSDSRCPMDALCVWAGDAIVVVSLSEGSAGHVERELHTQSSGSETLYRAYSIKLVALAPYPRSDRQIRPEDYVATLTVEGP